FPRAVPPASSPLKFFPAAATLSSQSPSLTDVSESYLTSGGVGILFSGGNAPPPPVLPYSFRCLWPLPALPVSRRSSRKSTTAFPHPSSREELSGRAHGPGCLHPARSRQP